MFKVVEGLEIELVVVVFAGVGIVPFHGLTNFKLSALPQFPL